MAVPSAPTGVNVVISAANALDISWSAVADATSYNIYWSGATGVSKSSSKISGITATHYMHGGRSSGNTYFYVVTAVNSAGESSESAEAFALLNIPQPPGVLAAVAGDGQATLSWNASAGISYNVYLASQSGVTKVNYASLADGMSFSNVASPYSITGLQNGKTYYFVVTGINSFGESVESSELSLTPAAVSSLTVSGAVKYEDKEYGTSGFTGNTSFKALRYAAVEAVDSASGATLATATTDANGTYSLTLPSVATVYIRAVSSASSPLSSLTPLVSVKDMSNGLFAVAGPSFTASGAAMANISIATTSQAAGAFNILDVYTSAAQFVYSLSGSYPPALASYWQTGNTYGTYFCPAPDPYSCLRGAGIYILSSGGDTDEYDDDVLWHEYGHFIAATYSKDDSPGGVHYLLSNDLDLRLSWSEGWGDFFPAALKDWLTTNAPTLLSTAQGTASSVYVDTAYGGANFVDFDITAGGPYIYASNEVAVAKVLIRTRANQGMQAVWDVFASNNLKSATTPVNLEVFWDAWNSLGNPDITTTFIDRLIWYSADNYESANEDTPNNLRKAVVNGSSENHTLYGSGDVDVIAFDALLGQPITLTTSALRNGADTYIRILAPDATTVVASNDNTNGANYAVSPFVPNLCDYVDGVCHENGYDILGSTASFSAAATETYYVEVSSSASRPLSAGRYGEYRLTITSP